MPLLTVVATVITPVATAHANTLWVVENFTSADMHLTASANATALGASHYGRMWAFLQNQGTAVVTFTSAALGAVTLRLTEEGADCSYTDPAGNELPFRTQADLNCLYFYPSAGNAHRVRIAENSLSGTGIRQVGGPLHSVEAEWILPKVTADDCKWGPNWMKAEVAMIAGGRKYRIGTKTSCYSSTHPALHDAHLYYGKFEDNGVDVGGPIVPGSRVHAQIMYLGGGSNKFLFTLDVTTIAGVTVHYRKWIEDDGKGGVQARDVNDANACSASCKPGNGKPKPPSVAAWFITAGDSAFPLEWRSSPDMAVSVRINETSPLLNPHDPALRTDITTQVSPNEAPFKPYLYPFIGIGEGAVSHEEALPFTALTVSAEHEV